MKITLAQLEALVWVAHLGTAQEAARQLNLTQPTISLRLKDLSEALGRPMFYRDGRRLILTADALNIFDHACLILEEAGKIIDKSHSDNFRGVVHMGMSEAVAYAGLPSLLVDIAQRYPDLRLEVAIGSSVNLQHDLYERTLDLALGMDLYEDDRIRVMPLGVQKAVWVAAPSQKLPAVVTPADIVHLPIFTNPKPTPMYRQTMNWFRSVQLEPQEISVSNSINVIAHLVKMGIGLAILPLKLVEEDIKNGSLIALGCAPELGHSYMSIAYRIKDWRPSIGAVLEASREMLKRLEWLEKE